ncbi:MAG: AbiU2 domain-containing protein [Promethearchaeota archaeon]
MTLLYKKPEEIIKKQYIKDYKNSLEIIWLELVRLNSTVFVLEKLINFPAKIFLPKGKDLFLNLVYHNFIENCIIIISRIFTDKSKDTHTIIWFKNKIRNKYLKDIYKDEFDKMLKERKFSKNVNTLSDKIHKIRSKLVAHLKRELLLNEITSDFKISFKELKEVVNAIEDLFILICFGHGHHLYPIQWIPNLVRNDPLDNRTDIDEILDYFVLQNPILKLPEENPSLWNKIKLNYSHEELVKFDEYRKKFGYNSVLKNS